MAGTGNEPSVRSRYTSCCSWASKGGAMRQQWRQRQRQPARGRWRLSQQNTGRLMMQLFQFPEKRRIKGSF